jgi:hypothetical protein
MKGRPWNGKVVLVEEEAEAEDVGDVGDDEVLSCLPSIDNAVLIGEVVVSSIRGAAFA